jgi:hypothetical protein
VLAIENRLTDALLILEEIGKRKLKVEKGSSRIIVMATDYGFDMDGFLKRIEPAYRAVKGLPADMRGYGEQYLDLLGAGILSEAFIAKVDMPSLYTPENEKLGNVLAAIGGEEGLRSYSSAWSGLRDTLTIHPTPYDLMKEVLFKVEEMKGINDPGECISWMDKSAGGKTLSERDRAKKN